MDEEDGSVTDVMGNENDYGNFNIMKIIQMAIASTGMITNSVVVIVFLNDGKMRRKIPNICIINQVCTLLHLPNAKQSRYKEFLKETNTLAD